MKRKIICYFENEAQCEAAVTALCSAKIDASDIRIISESTKRSDPTAKKPATVIGSSAPFALPSELNKSEESLQTTLAQAPVATLLIRGDLFTFHGTDDTPLGSYAVEVCGDKDTLDLARDILLNLF